MALFIDTLTDGFGDKYEYGHCYRDDDMVTGCGMEYEYYPERETLNFWHDGVGYAHTKQGFSTDDRDALEALHERCHDV